MKPKPQYKVVRRYKSKTRPDRAHVVTVDRKTGQLTCTCEGFTYRQRCWHVDRCIDILAESYQ